jgi:hypothetical protein
MNLPLEQSRPHFNGILLKLRFRRENRANASVTQAKGAVGSYLFMSKSTHQSPFFFDFRLTGLETQSTRLCNKNYQNVQFLDI